MLIDIFDYLTDYDPAMPTVEVIIGATGTAPTVRIKALVDSGADGTILPLQQLKQIDARKYQKKWMRTVTGQRAQVDMYLVAMQIGGLPPIRLAVAGDPQLNEAIVGRDWLNRFVVRLDGPAMVVQLFAP